MMDSRPKVSGLSFIAYNVYILLIFTKVLKVNLFAFAYKLFHEDFSPIDAAPRRLERNLNLHESL